jgi:hypothetical protein
MLKVAIVGTLLPALLLATLAAARDLVWWQILGVLPVSWYLADLVVGLVHFTGDFLAWPQFIGHHDDPHFMTTKGYVHHTFRSYCLAFAACRLLPLASWTSLAQFAFLLTAFFAVQGNEMHKWLHVRKGEKPAWVALSQRWGLVISTREHHGHHQGAYDRNFCTLSGWANPLLNMLTVRVFHDMAQVHARLKTNPNYQSLVKMIMA